MVAEAGLLRRLLVGNTLKSLITQEQLDKLFTWLKKNSYLYSCDSDEEYRPDSQQMKSISFCVGTARNTRSSGEADAHPLVNNFRFPSGYFPIQHCGSMRQSMRSPKKVFLFVRLSLFFNARSRFLSKFGCSFMSGLFDVHASFAVGKAAWFYLRKRIKRGLTLDNSCRYVLSSLKENIGQWSFEILF